MQVVVTSMGSFATERFDALVAPRAVGHMTDTVISDLRCGRHVGRWKSLARLSLDARGLVWFLSCNWHRGSSPINGAVMNLTISIRLGTAVGRVPTTRNSGQDWTYGLR